jgi:hypothetical protein
MIVTTALGGERAHRCRTVYILVKYPVDGITVPTRKVGNTKKDTMG